MKIKISLILLFCLSLNLSFAQIHQKKITQIISALQKVHVYPIGVNDQLSERVYSEFIEAIDPNSLLFLNEDISDFSMYKTEIDDQISKGNLLFFDLVLARYNKRLSQVDSITTAIFSNRIDFYTDEKLTFGKDSTLSYAKSLDDLSMRWQKWTKLEMLQIMYANYPKLNFNNKDSVDFAINFALSKEKAETKCWLDGYGFKDIEYTEDMLLYEFLNSIALAYDPHSSYFTEEIKESFDISLSKDSKDFGIHFIKEDGVFKISSINPGSSAWKSNMVNVGDVVYKIETADGELNLNCLDEYDLEDVLLSTDSDELILSLIKKGGEKIEVELTKEILETEDNIMTGILLEKEKKIGYISIPSFYTNWESESAIGCANDVAKEILKLKKENIEGLIIDLRFNGGGSVKEALDLAGIFIDVGPLGIMSAQKGKPYLLKDPNRGRAYSGPLVIMINGASASASEMFAGAMQSYNRGVVVGSPSYGKSTGQVVVPIDTSYWYSDYDEEPTDYVKVTTSKVYNIDNGTHQAKGIIPDISIPDIWDCFIPTEADERYFIPNDSINKIMYFTPYTLLPIEILKNQSATRIKNSEKFQKVLVSNDSINNASITNYDIPLNLTGYWNFKNTENEQYEIWKNAVSNFSSNIVARNTTYYADLEKLDETFNKRSQKIFKRIKKDMMLDEAYHIMIDLIIKM